VHSASNARAFCLPHPSIQKVLYIPFTLSLLALIFTAIGSWDCHYFKGASIVFTSANYGLWTLQDKSGKCQLWDQLFFSFDLGPMLHTARAFSILAQLDGMAMTVVMCQALQFHGAFWAMFLALFLLFISSIFTTGLFNLWTFFFLFTYIIFTLVIRLLFVHPIHRRISQRGCKIICANCFLCSIFTFLTLIVLKSDYCTCTNLTSERLDGRESGEDELCNGICQLGVSGALMIVAGTLWLMTSIAVHKYGIQPNVFKQNNEDLKKYAHYPKRSIVSRMATSAVNTAAVAAATATAVNDVVRSPFRNSKSYSENENGNGNDKPDDVHDNDQDQKEKPDTRSCCKKVCFDYRVTTRTSKEKCLFWSFRVCIGVLVIIYIMFIVFKVGSFYENIEAGEAADTSYNFILDDVCAFNPNNTEEPFISYPSKQDAVNAGYVVAHCGKCANCSNPWDIKTYVETRKTIAITAKTCGIYAVFGTYADLTNCLKKKIGFTLPCTKCWTDNMLNTAENCLFTCMKATFTGSARTNNVKGTGDKTVWLNQCIFCDEKMSGPEFVTCSGVARRRLGVKSEIERNPEEQCRNVDVDWVNVNFDELFPQLINMTMA
jgi:hypothetical protein